MAMCPPQLLLSLLLLANTCLAWIAIPLIIINLSPWPATIDFNSSNSQCFTTIDYKVKDLHRYYNSWDSDDLGKDFGKQYAKYTPNLLAFKRIFGVPSLKKHTLPMTTAHTLKPLTTRDEYGAPVKEAPIGVFEAETDNSGLCAFEARYKSFAISVNGSTEEFTLNDPAWDNWELVKHATPQDHENDDEADTDTTLVLGPGGRASFWPIFGEIAGAAIVAVIAVFAFFAVASTVAAEGVAAAVEGGIALAQGGAAIEGGAAALEVAGSAVVEESVASIVGASEAGSIIVPESLVNSVVSEGLESMMARGANYAEYARKGISFADYLKMGNTYVGNGLIIDWARFVAEGGLESAALLSPAVRKRSTQDVMFNRSMADNMMMGIMGDDEECICGSSDEEGGYTDDTDSDTSTPQDTHVPGPPSIPAGGTAPLPALGAPGPSNDTSMRNVVVNKLFLDFTDAYGKIPERDRTACILGRNVIANYECLVAGVSLVIQANGKIVAVPLPDIYRAWD